MASPVWVAVGYLVGNSEVQVAIPIKTDDAESYVTALLQAQGEPIVKTVDADPIRAWIPKQI